MGCCCSSEKDEEKDEKENRKRHKGRRRVGNDEDQDYDRKSNIRSARGSVKAAPGLPVYVAVFRYEPGSASEVALEKGERVELLNKEAGGFYFVRQLKLHGTRGFVPMEFLALEGSTLDEDFFYGTVRRREAEKALMDEKLPEGCFLVRSSEGGAQGEYESTTKDIGGSFSLFVISVKDGSNPAQIHHYRIQTTSSGDQFFLRPQKKFATIREMVTFYQTNAPGQDLCTKLSKHVSRQPPVRRELSQEMRERWREIPREQLQLTNVLGEGRFGEVHKAIWKMTGGQPVVVVAKHLKTLSLIDKQSLLNEAAMMKDLVHENIVKLYGVVSSSEPYWIITEFIKDGSLQDYLKSRRKQRLANLETVDLIDICTQICRGMSYLSSKRIVHRDLAARNVLIDVKSESPFNCTAKICDFGLARTLNKDYIYKMKHETYIATRWLAPEGFETVFSSETDVWAFGVTMSEIFSCGDDPWQDLNEKEVKQRIESGRGPEKPRDMPTNVYVIMKRCCQMDPKSRPPFNQLAIEFDGLVKTMDSTKSRPPTPTSVRTSLNQSKGVSAIQASLKTKANSTMK